MGNQKLSKYQQISVREEEQDKLRKQYEAQKEIRTKGVEKD